MYKKIYEDDHLIIELSENKKLIRISGFKNGHFVDDFTLEVDDYFGDLEDSYDV